MQHLLNGTCSQQIETGEQTREAEERVHPERRGDDGVFGEQTIRVCLTQEHQGEDLKREPRGIGRDENRKSFYRKAVGESLRNHPRVTVC